MMENKYFKKQQKTETQTPVKQTNTFFSSSSAKCNSTKKNEQKI